MKVTYSWLKDFVEIKIPPQRLADKLTMAGLEVVSLEEKEGDFVFEIEITSNRPDWLSVIGIAREVAAITGKNLKTRTAPKALVSKAAKGPAPAINIEDKKDCSLYTGKIIRDVKVWASPEWLKKRLEAVGCRSVNNIVDITNYILFETGHPLHAFDLDKLNSSSIIVRRAKPQEKITGIDGEERVLDPDILVIADEKKAVALAGIMGGKDTEVSGSTGNIFLEAAVFNPGVIRQGRQKLGLQSESSYRFERGVNPLTVEDASHQAAKLILELASGTYVYASASGVLREKKKIIPLDMPGANRILGTTIKAAQARRILTGLGFKTKQKNKDTLAVEVPSQRQDINIDMDLIEEITRIFGYENIETSLPAVAPQIKGQDERAAIDLIKNMLTGLGLNEVITYSLVDEGSLRVSNPLSKEQAFLRTTLIPSLGRCISYNLNQKQEYVNIFEIAKTFSSSDGRIKEEWTLAIALSGAKSFWLDEGRIKDKAGFLHLKGITETLFGRLGIQDYGFSINPDGDKIDVSVQREKAGFMLKFQQDALEKLDIKNKDVFAAEIPLGKILSYAGMKKIFIPLPLYPAISRDISLVLKEDIQVEKLLETIREKAGPLLREAKVIDCYKGKQIPDGFKGLTISCLYRSDERTLTETEINPLHSAASGALAEKFNVKLR